MIFSFSCCHFKFQWISLYFVVLLPPFLSCWVSICISINISIHVYKHTYIGISISHLLLRWVSESREEHWPGHMCSCHCPPTRPTKHFKIWRKKKKKRGRLNILKYWRRRRRKKEADWNNVFTFINVILLQYHISYHILYHFL